MLVIFGSSGFDFDVGLGFDLLFGVLVRVFIRARWFLDWLGWFGREVKQWSCGMGFRITAAQGTSGVVATAYIGLGEMAFL